MRGEPRATAATAATPLSHAPVYVDARTPAMSVPSA